MTKHAPSTLMAREHIRKHRPTEREFPLAGSNFQETAARRESRELAQR
jgi:hypothetical protein